MEIGKEDCPNLQVPTNFQKRRKNFLICQKMKHV